MVSSHDHSRVRHQGGRSHRNGHRRNHAYHPGRAHRSNRPGYERSRINDYNRYKYTDEDFESIISPCVKYSLFFFNFIFWVSFTTLNLTAINTINPIHN